MRGPTRSLAGFALLFWGFTLALLRKVTRSANNEAAGVSLAARFCNQANSSCVEKTLLPRIDQIPVEELLLRHQDLRVRTCVVVPGALRRTAHRRSTNGPDRRSDS